MTVHLAHPCCVLEALALIRWFERPGKPIVAQLIENNDEVTDTFLCPPSVTGSGVSEACGSVVWRVADPEPGRSASTKPAVAVEGADQVLDA